MGWYGNNACTFGQKLGAFARLYLVTEDERLREKALALADGWGECASLNRCWKEGNRVDMEFAFSLRFEPVDEYAPNVAALCYGPLTLVCDKMTLFEGDIKHPSDWIEPVQKEGYSFSFRTKPGHVKPFAHLTRDFYPYYEVGEREWYYMYNRIEKKE